MPEGLTFRAYNEHETELRRTHVYLLNALLFGALFSYARLYAMAVIGRLSGWTRYDRDTYAQFDVGDLPPGKFASLFR